MPKVKTRKRRCKICKRWFLPDVRHIDRQKTCGPECRRELHRKRCGQYNQKNRKLAKADYLQKKLDAVKLCCRKPPTERIDTSVGGPRIQLDLPRDVIQKTIGLRLLVVIEYVVEQIFHRSKLAQRASEAGGQRLSNAPAHRESG